MLTPAEIAAIQDRAEKATPGKWSINTAAWRYHTPTHGHIGCPDGRKIALLWDTDNAKQDAAFIVGCRTDVPALLAHIDAITARVAELERENEQLAAAYRNLTLRHFRPARRIAR